MQQSLALVVMVLLLVTLPLVEHEAHVVLDDGVPKSCLVDFLPQLA